MAAHLGIQDAGLWFGEEMNEYRARQDSRVSGKRNTFVHLQGTDAQKRLRLDKKYTLAISIKE